MTRRDYILIASALREADLTDSARHKAAKALAAKLGEQNRNFDYDRFVNACHGEA